METRLSVRGNAVQPVLLMFPLGLLAVAVILDVSRLLGAPTLVGTLAYCTVVAGLVGGTVTAIAVWIDRITVRQTMGARTETVRRLLDLAVLIAIAVILLLRMRTPERTAGPGLVALEALGVGVAGTATWWDIRLGGGRS
jgi:uncharacterized membrane protein